MYLISSVYNGRIACVSWALALFLPGAAAATETLHPLVITATMNETALSDAPASVDLIERKQLQQRPVQDLADALRGSPGVDLPSVGLTRRGIRIRGMDSKYTLSLINGRRINAAADAIAHADFDLGWLPMAAIERIELVRGPMSSLYGSEALGGVVNMITRSATDEWQGSAQLDGGFVDNGRGGDSQQLGLYLGGPLLTDKLGLSLYGETRRKQEVIRQDDRLLSEQEGRRAQSGGMTLTLTPDANQRLDFDWLQGDEQRTRYTRENASKTSPAYYYRSNDRIERQQLSLTHRMQWQWGNSQLRTWRSTLSKDNHRNRGAAIPRQKLVDDTFDGHVSLDATDFQRLTAGAEWRREHLDDSRVSSSGEAELIHRALFLQDEARLSDDLSLTLGSRADHHDAFGWHHSPRLYALWQLAQGLRLKGGVGKGFKAPTLKQLSAEYSAIGGGNSFLIFGNPRLKPETVTSYELGLNWQGEKQASGGITLFQNNLKNLITTLCVANCGPGGPMARREYVNVNRARLRGLELAAESARIFGFSLQGNYTWLSAKDLEKGKTLTERPRHRGASTLVWQPAEAFRAALRSEYNGSQTVETAKRTRTRLPAYWLHSLDLSYPLSKNLSLRSSVENLSNKTLLEDSALYPYAETGRAYHLGITFHF